MRKQTKLKAFVLSVAMTIVMSLPMTMNAQSDGFIRNGGNYDGNRDDGLSNQSFGSETGGPQAPTDLVPLGSGLLIMVTAGAGYALLKKKED